MTLSVFTIIIAVLVLAAAFFVLRATPATRAYFKFRGKHVITCPETQKPEAVDIAAGEAALGVFFSQPTMHLKDCSRWPVRQDCGQECLSQIEQRPADCLVWNMVKKWYEGSTCAFCHKPIGPLHHIDHAPAVIGPDHTTREWKDVRPEQLPEIFKTHRPVCWNCHIAENFRRTHPELVTDRPFEPRRIG